MERFKKTMEEIIRAIRKAPGDISSKLGVLFSRLSDFAQEHPDLPEKILPTLLAVQSHIIEGNYAEAYKQVFLLLVLIGIKWKKK